MEIIGTGEVRQNIASTLRKVADGEIVLVGRFGDLRAVIMPPAWAEFFVDEEVDQSLRELRKEFPDKTDFEIMKAVLTGWGKIDTKSQINQILELVTQIAQK